ncbi:unnamed protein product [Prorocentrum cordatum]|uniref:Uncharacterized protein n=1 Tax=Prorocentrum cordatum TaxID=2364126 RepID=A0ABN9S983_9DINO|nr:unnamed protein product [Polarella glacialis]
MLARRNAEAHGATNVTFAARDAADGLHGVQADPDETVVLVDPPRAGLSPGARAALRGLGPRRLVYVSCDCHTQARDLRELTAGGYAVRAVTPLDLFPQTRHLESVVVLERGAAPPAPPGAGRVQRVGPP